MVRKIITCSLDWHLEVGHDNIEREGLKWIGRDWKNGKAIRTVHKSIFPFHYTCISYIPWDYKSQLDPSKGNQSWILMEGRCQRLETQCWCEKPAHWKKALLLGRWRQEEEGDEGWGWLDGTTYAMDISGLLSSEELVMDKSWHAAVRRVWESDMTDWGGWTRIQYLLQNNPQLHPGFIFIYIHISMCLYHCNTYTIISVWLVLLFSAPGFLHMLQLVFLFLLTCIIITLLITAKLIKWRCERSLFFLFQVLHPLHSPGYVTSLHFLISEPWIALQSACFNAGIFSPPSSDFLWSHF